MAGRSSAYDGSVVTRETSDRSRGTRRGAVLSAGSIALLGGLVLGLGTVLICVGAWAGKVEDKDTIGAGLIVVAAGYLLISLGATNWLWAIVIAISMFGIPSLVCEVIFASTEAYGNSYAGAFFLLPLGTIAALLAGAVNGLWHYGWARRPTKGRR